MTDDLGEYISRDAQIVRDLGWEDFVKERIYRGDFSDLRGVKQPAHRLLRYYWHRRTPVVFPGQWWKEGKRRAPLDRGLYKSTMAHIPFLR